MESQLGSYKMKIGDPAPEFSLPGADGQDYSLTDFQDKQILVVIFSCNHCPYARAIWPRLVKLDEAYRAKGVQLVAINANDAEAYPDDSFEKMKPFADEQAIGFPYLHDEQQTVARAYGGQCTPHVLLFDKERKLRYQGRVDDNWKDEGAVQKQELRDAIEAVLNNQTPNPDTTAALGCSIKWKT
jgi:peroxiredoxin